MAHDKQKSAFEHAQNMWIHIILHMCKVSFQAFALHWCILL